MARKIWHKPLHQRKAWKQISILNKIIYYMQPFVEHFLDTWMQPLPFPTILKVMYSCILSIFILLPIIYPGAIFLLIYAEVQYVFEMHTGICFPERLDLLGYAGRLYNFEIINEKYKLFLLLYIERWRILGTAIASSIDYIRLSLSLVFEVFEN